MNNLAVQELQNERDFQMPLQDMITAFTDQVHRDRAIEKFAKDVVTKLLQFDHTQQISCDNKLLGIATEKQEQQQLQRKIGQISLNGYIAASAQRILSFY